MNNSQSAPQEPSDDGGGAKEEPLPSQADSIEKAGGAAASGKDDSAVEVHVPEAAELGVEQEVPAEPEPQLSDRIKNLFIGKPRDLADRAVYSHISLAAFLAWVGLGADGLSSSCYGPPEAFAHLVSAQHGDHTYLAIFLALATVITVLVISACYSHIIEVFPAGGGGYLVASKLLGPPVGVISGSALIVDYVLTITVSIAAAGDALWGFVPPDYESLKLPTEFGAILLLIGLNLRGLKETITFLLPIFITFLVTHVVLIGGSIGKHLPEAVATFQRIGVDVQENLADPKIGFWVMMGLLLRAYSLGAGTYTGIEAVSNSMPVMREPRVATAKRTMLYMAFSLAITAGGLMVAYLLLGIRHSDGGKTMNFLLTEQFIKETFGFGVVGTPLLWITIFSEALLLFVAAQAGFIDGPRILANLAQDNWAPHWFGSLSERLATHNGIIIMGGAALAALWYTGGNVTTLVIMYSINVFLTFSLSMIGMLLYWWRRRNRSPVATRRLALFGVGALFCLSILCVTVYEKFFEGGWRTLFVTGALVAAFYCTRAYYNSVNRRLKKLDDSLGKIAPPNRPPNTDPPDPGQPAAAILVGGYSGLGVHTLLNAVRFAPGYFKSVIFISVGVVDTGNFKGADAVDGLRDFTEETLKEYITLAQKLGLPATSYMSIGTDPVDELEKVCLAVKKDFPQAMFFAGRLMFRRDSWYQRLFHNQTAYSLQHRLQWDGIPMTILPTRVR
jgi:amino acid transporter